GGRWLRFVDHSWQMYPIGILFGLGFDTASEIALITMTAASAGTLSFAGLLSLPLLFAAGMLAVDTTDSVVMSRAYRWALEDGHRRFTYNALVTGISACVALALAGTQAADVLSSALGTPTRVSVGSALDSSAIGFLIAVGLLILWGLAVLTMRRRLP